MRKNIHILMLTTTLLLLLAACTALPGFAKTDLQVAEETVECMMQNDPDIGLGIAFMSGKDAYARLLEQTQTRDQLIAERDEACNTPLPTERRPTAPPTISPTSTAFQERKTPDTTNTGAPPNMATNRFLELRYDASKTMNNRQAPAQRDCTGGSRRTILWPRTHDVRGEKAFIQDAQGITAQVISLEFALVHPGRKFSDHQCPGNELHARATLESTVAGYEPDLTVYTAEWQNQDGNPIVRDSAHDGIAIKMAQDSQPEALYDQPARLLIYDQYTPGAQPTSTPQPQVQPAQKQVDLLIDSTDWEITLHTTDRDADSHWTVIRKESPDLSPKPHEIYDAADQKWRVVGIGVLEQHGKQGRYQDNWTDYTIVLGNTSRATANFTGYEVSLEPWETDSSGGVSNHWQPPDGPMPIGQAIFEIRIPTEMQGPLTLRIWDTYEPGLPLEVPAIIAP